MVSGQAGPVLFGAVIALRRAQFEEALSAVEQLTERELPAGSLAAVRAYALHGLGRHEESRDVAAAGLSEDVDEETKSRLLHVRGLAHLSLGEPALALKYALGSYEADRSNPDPLGLIRRARDAKSPASQFLDILCRGTEDGGEFAARFIRFSVVAEGVEEALSFILEIEGGSAGSSLAVDEVLSRHPAPDQLKGVYRVSRRVPFKPG